MLAAGGLQLFQGFQQMQAANEQAAAAETQARMQAAEAGRIAGLQAQQEAEAADTAERQQKLAFLKSGVELEGSPLLVMEETRQQGEENVQEILMGGAAASQSALFSGQTQAANLRAQGRSAFTSGLTSAAKSGYNYAN